MAQSTMKLVPLHDSNLSLSTCVRQEAISCAKIKLLSIKIVKNYPPFVIRGKGWGRGEERVVGSNTKHPASIGGVWIVSGRTKFEFI